jgi:hypothetical protein
VSDSTTASRKRAARPTAQGSKRIALIKKTARICADRHGRETGHVRKGCHDTARCICAPRRVSVCCCSAHVAEENQRLPVVNDLENIVGVVSGSDFLRRTEIGTKRQRSRWVEFFMGPGRLADEWRAVLSIWQWCSTGSAAGCCRGDCRHDVKQHSASERWRTRWLVTASRTSSTPTRACGSPARPSPACSAATASQSAWTKKAPGETGSSSNGCGAASNMRRYL